MKVLLTGGMGFIGSHTAVLLIQNGYDVIIVDNLCNSKKDVLDSIEKITGVKPKFYLGDVQDEKLLDRVFSENKIDYVIHFAGLKAVGESVSKPLLYYSNNLDSTLVLLNVMGNHNCKNLVFSSSATVYGKPESLPIKEDFPLSTTNPYGSTKLMIEMILKDLYKSDSSWNIVILRYFNPIGAHESGLIGENPNDIPNNLMPYIVKVATKEYDHLNVFGDDYPTPDGTGVRDYIHVLDLARGHVLALKKLETNPGLVTYNLGTGKGTSVLEIIKDYEKATGIKINYVIKPRRAGDVAENYADCSKAKEELGFTCKYNVFDACLDGYNFQKKENQNK